MKTTGIIRRIDDLGRIVIPKEVRKTMRIKNGESIEIFLDNEDIILKKYSPMETIDDISSKYVEAIYQTIKHNIIVTDRDKVIAFSSNLKNKYSNLEISEFVDRSIDRRDNFTQRQKNKVEFAKGVDEYCTFSFSSIVSNGDCLGSVIVFSYDKMLLEVEEKIAVVLSKLLSKYFVD